MTELDCCVCDYDYENDCKAEQRCKKLGIKIIDEKIEDQ